MPAFPDADFDNTTPIVCRKRPQFFRVPFGDIFRAGCDVRKRRNVVDIRVIEFLRQRLDDALKLHKIDRHSLLIETIGLHFNFHFPTVAVQRLRGAFIRAKVMRRFEKSFHANSVALLCRLHSRSEPCLRGAVNRRNYFLSFPHRPGAFQQRDLLQQSSGNRERAQTAYPLG